jgi:integrase
VNSEHGRQRQLSRTDVKIVSDQLGHRPVEMYQHLSADLQRAAAEALGRRLFDDVDDDTTFDTG